MPRMSPRAPEQRLFAVGSPPRPRIIVWRASTMHDTTRNSGWPTDEITPVIERESQATMQSHASPIVVSAQAGDDGHPHQSGGASDHPGAAHRVGSRPAGRRRRDRHAGGWGRPSRPGRGCPRGGIRIRISTTWIGVRREGADPSCSTPPRCRLRRSSTSYLSFAQILSEFGCWCQQSPTACEQMARCRGYCQQKAVMAAESTVVTGQYVTGHSALPSTQPAALPICSSVSATNGTCSGRGALELTSNLRER